ncbi:MAG TPA: glycosyltransferase family 2 protein [Candidatus Cybelea sp.]|jgi:glycosyltransferase involved in cell wall biosynthesis|nr:glycosyltransferase family 2 protein [Candidatus Cybelea sp.]
MITICQAGSVFPESQPSSPVLSILMPAYNEAHSIAENVCETMATMRALGIDSEIVVIDDGSMDGTHAAASTALRAWPDRVRVVRCPRNEGKGNALICGATYSRGDYVAFLDADMDLHPEQLANFFAIMEAQDADAVIGSKFHPGSKVEYPPLRRVYSFFYYMLVRSLFGLPVRDTQTGIKLFKREVLDRVLPRVLVKRFAFDLELLANVHHFGYRIAEAPVTLNFQRVCSRLRLPAVWNVFLDTLAIFYRMRILHYYDRPLRAPAQLDFAASSHEIVAPVTIRE